eukprot:COSAG02_NODE_2466_length_8783_cov_405.845463_1_plen_69_part_00
MYYYDSSIVHVVEHSIVRSIYGEVHDVVPTFATSVPILSRHSRKRPIFVQDPAVVLGSVFWAATCARQ